MGFELIDTHQNAIVTLINSYKEKIKKTHIKDERYKWELIKKYFFRVQAQ